MIFSGAVVLSANMANVTALLVCLLKTAKPYGELDGCRNASPPFNSDVD